MWSLVVIILVILVAGGSGGSASYLLELKDDDRLNVKKLTRYVALGIVGAALVPVLLEVLAASTGATPQVLDNLFDTDGPNKSWLVFFGFCLAAAVPPDQPAGSSSCANRRMQVLGAALAMIKPRIGFGSDQDVSAVQVAVAGADSLIRVPQRSGYPITDRVSLLPVNPVPE